MRHQSKMQVIRSKKVIVFQELEYLQQNQRKNHNYY